MCAPVALGVASFATGAIGAFGQYRSGQAQAAASNRAAASNYKYQLKMREHSWDRERYAYGQKIHDYEKQVDSNTAAANMAYAAEQRRLNDAYKQAAFANQGQLGKLLQMQGRMAAQGEMSGRSADRVQSQMNAQYGRNKAIMDESLFSARNKQRYQNDAIRRELISSNNSAYSSVAINPMPGVAPPQPVMQQGPSKFGLLSGLGQAALGGYQSYNDAFRYQPSI